jgi:hypothetical protein
MRAVTLFAALAAALFLAVAAQEDACVAELAACREDLCAGLEVLSNTCTSTSNGFSKSCACGGPLAAVEQPRVAAEEEDAAMTVETDAEVSTEEEQEVASVVAQMAEEMKSAVSQEDESEVQVRIGFFSGLTGASESDAFVAYRSLS